MRNTQTTTKPVDMTTCKNCKNCICKMNCKTFSIKAEMFKDAKLLTVQVLCTLDKMNYIKDQVEKLQHNPQDSESRIFIKNLLDNFLPKLTQEIIAYEMREEKTLSKVDCDFVYDYLENTLKDTNLVQEFENMYNLKDKSDNLYKNTRRWYTKAQEKFFREFGKNL